MDMLADPNIWLGLLTLIVLEIVLGVDNLVFIAILAKKLPDHQQGRAMYTGLGLALAMRLVLLTIMSWLVTLTTPLFSIWEHPFSARDLILFAGGVFLLIKATTELHERIEALPHSSESSSGKSKFWLVIAQILLLDAVFSVDSIITAVGMVDNLAVMASAVVVAMVVMVAASRPLTEFVNRHPTVIVLCLSFLLMIGLSLVAEGLGFHIPKGYLYAAIAFSIMIEAFNQLARRNSAKQLARLPFRERTTQAIGRLMEPSALASASEEKSSGTKESEQSFGEDEREMIEGVLSLADRPIRMVMTPRSDIAWLDVTKSLEEILQDARTLHHSMFPVAEGSLERIIGFVKAKDLVGFKGDVEALREQAKKRKLLTVPETASVIGVMRFIKRARASLVIVADEFGVVQGLVTAHDVLEAIAGDFPDEGDKCLIQSVEGGWLADGTADLFSIEQALGCDGLIQNAGDFVTVAGLMLHKLGRLPKIGDSIELSGWKFEAAALERNRIKSVRISLLQR